MRQSELAGVVQRRVALGGGARIHVGAVVVQQLRDGRGVPVRAGEVQRRNAAAAAAAAVHVGARVHQQTDDAIVAVPAGVVQRRKAVAVRAVDNLSIVLQQFKDDVAVPVGGGVVQRSPALVVRAVASWRPATQSGGAPRGHPPPRWRPVDSVSSPCCSFLLWIACYGCNGADGAVLLIANKQRVPRSSKGARCGSTHREFQKFEILAVLTRSHKTRFDSQFRTLHRSVFDGICDGISRSSVPFDLSLDRQSPPPSLSSLSLGLLSQTSPRSCIAHRILFQHD